MNTIKKSITIMALAIIAFSCGNKNTNKYVVNGQVQDVEDGTEIYLYDFYNYKTRNAKPIDTAIVTNGTFTFTDTITTPMMAYASASPRKGGLEFILEAGNISINIDENTVTGTPLNERLTQYFNECNVTDYQKESAEIIKIYYSIDDENIKDSLSNRFEEIHEQYIVNSNEAADRLFNENKSNILGRYAVSELLEAVPTVEQLLSVRDAEGSIVKDDERLNKEIERLQAAEATSDGKQYVDFECINFSTNELGKLSDVIGGKLAIVDFWASWCSPCRDEIKENLIRISEKYAKQGLVVVGVDVWDQIDKHAAMVEKLGITYPQVIDTANIASKIYGFNGIPEIMLVGKDGIIINRGIRGEEIENAVVNALNK